MSLPAVILVGGQGTRLRPLTERIRKDMLPLVDRPLLAFTFEHLRGHGVRRGIVSCGYLPTQIKAHFGSAYGDLELTYHVEEEPLGTAGGIAFAGGDIDEREETADAFDLSAVEACREATEHADRGGDREDMRAAIMVWREPHMSRDRMSRPAASPPSG